jgi:hypothetical protein
MTPGSLGFELLTVHNFCMNLRLLMMITHTSHDRCLTEWSGTGRSQSRIGLGRTTKCNRETRTQ